MGLKLLKSIRSFQPDLVIMDITMPEMDGIQQSVKYIKELNPEAKIIMCSAMGQQAMVIESIQAGARDFIVKPFQAERVLEAVKKLLIVRWRILSFYLLANLCRVRIQRIPYLSY